MKISGDYQFKALTKGFFVQRNWHDNKLNLPRILNLEDKSKDMVDIGCGSGNLLFRYANAFRSLKGIDNSEDALAFVAGQIKKNKIKNIMVALHNLVEKDSLEKYDLGICMEVIEHFDMKTLDRGVFSNICSFVKPRGMLFITTPNKVSLWPLIEKFLDIFKLVPNLSSDQHFSSFSSSDLTDMLEKHGFEVLSVGSFNHISALLPLSFLRGLVLKAEVKYIRRYGPLLYALAVKKSN